MAKLGEKQETFVKEYLIDLNATQAAIRAGYSRKNASRIAIELLNKTHVSESIRKEMAKREKRTEVSADRVVLELARIGFGDLRDVASWDASEVRLKSSLEIGDDAAAAISEVSITTTKDGRTVRIKRHDKTKALELLARHLGLLDQKEKSADSTGTGIITALKEIFNAD